MKSVALTFDLDFTDYLNEEILQDEFEQCWPIFTNICQKMPQLKSTWFIRIDEQMGELYGAPDYIFSKHGEKINWLLEREHEIGWHFHSYRKSGEKWVQNSNENDVVNEMKKMQPYVQKYNLSIARMGWAYHTNQTVKTMAESGIIVDCSPMPRPNYKWDNALRDWSLTKNGPYYPSKTDYRVSGETAWPMLFIPFTMLPIKAEYDTEEGVLRYLNPCYHKSVFQMVIDSCEEQNINIVAHPYEFLANKNKHKMLAFDASVFEENLEYMANQKFNFNTISQFVEKVKNQNTK